MCWNAIVWMVGISIMGRQERLETRNWKPEIKIYGGGLISSKEDAKNALGPACDRRPFSQEAVIEQRFDIDRLQDVLFVIDDFAQLDEAVRALAAYRW